MNEYPRTYIAESEFRWRAVFLYEGEAVYAEQWQDGEWIAYQDRRWRESEMNSAGFERIA